MRQRPADGPGAVREGGSATALVAPDYMARVDIPAAIRRRRAASYRCPTLADGRRDPLDPPARRATIKVRAIGKSTVELAGCDRAVYDAITTQCVRYHRADGGGAWLIEQSAADDVLALLEHRGYRLEVTL